MDKDKGNRIEDWRLQKWIWRRMLRVDCTERRTNEAILQEIGEMRGGLSLLLRATRHLAYPNVSSHCSISHSLTLYHFHRQILTSESDQSGNISGGRGWTLDVTRRLCGVSSTMD